MKTNTARLSKLTIITKLSSAYKVWHGYLESLPRPSRYTLGVKIDNLFVELTELLLTASYSTQKSKTSILQTAGHKLDLLKFFLQVLWELELLDNKKYIGLSSQLEEVGRMLGGWHRQVREQTQNSPRIRLRHPPTGGGGLRMGEK
jgi:hypothetical protein